MVLIIINSGYAVTDSRLESMAERAVMVSAFYHIGYVKSVSNRIAKY